MKTIKDLKVGDICYLIDENTVADVKVVNIKVSMQTKLVIKDETF